MLSLFNTDNRLFPIICCISTCVTYASGGTTSCKRQLVYQCKPTEIKEETVGRNSLKNTRTSIFMSSDRFSSFLKRSKKATCETLIRHAPVNVKRLCQETGNFFQRRLSGFIV